MVNSKLKGNRGELEVAALLRKYGFKARRGQQFSGSPDSPDVKHNIRGFHIEVKRTETLSLYEAMGQAERDAKASDRPVVFHRRNGKDWLVVMRADDLLKLIASGDDE